MNRLSFQPADDARVRLIAATLTCSFALGCADLFGLSDPVLREKPKAIPLDASESDGTADASVDAKQTSNEPCTERGSTEVAECTDNQFKFRVCEADGNYGAWFPCASEGFRSLPPVPSEFVGRRYHASLWTGREVILWGGQRGKVTEPYLDDGVAYDPRANTWRRIAKSPLRARSHFVALYTPSGIVIAGGQVNPIIQGTQLELADDAAIYDPTTDAWSEPFDTGLGGRAFATGAFAIERNEVLLWGGISPSRVMRSTGVRINLETKRSLPLPNDTGTGVPSARTASSFWSANRFHVFLGEDIFGPAFNGAYWEPGPNLWTPMPMFPAAIAQGKMLNFALEAHPSNDGRYVFFGGKNQTATEYSNNGYVYSARTTTWTDLPVLASDRIAPGQSRGSFFVAGRFGFYGGIGAKAKTLGGGAMLARDGLSWEVLPESNLGPRLNHSAVGYGNEVFFWGGNNDNDNPITGALFRIRN
jgi:hypothetical protein